jgi:hypothetical protein
MNKRELKLLENIYESEISGAINGGVGLFQTKSRLAEKLEDDGYIVKDSVKLYDSFPVTVEGYRLTHYGRYIYCASCEDTGETK